MNSLSGRIVVLASLVALLSTAVCALVASRAALQGLELQEDRRAIAATEAVQRHLRRTLATLGYEVGDYARWDELYEQMPRPAGAWAAINLVPGSQPGGVTRELVTADADGVITGRYRASPDPALRLHDATLSSLFSAPTGSGLVVLDGVPALYTVAPVVRSDGSGQPRGRLLGLAHLDQQLRERLLVPGWDLAIQAAPAAGTDPGKPADAALAWSTARTADAFEASALVSAVGRPIALRLRSSRHADQLLAASTQAAIWIAGGLTALAAMLIGSLLGWHWLRPIRRLAVACRQLADDPAHPIPAVHGLTEAEVLADGIRALIAAERGSHAALTEALQRETVVNSVHRRFLAGLAHEFGQPIRSLLATIDRIHAQDGRLEPERIAAARQVAAQLEERFQEVLGLAVDLVSEDPDPAPLAPAAYLASVAELLRPASERRGLRIAIEAGEQGLAIEPRLLTPILVNLAANALTASAAGGTVALAARVDAQADESVWTVSDDGPGIPEDLARRIADSCLSGEVVAGSPGIGLGLAVALANTRALRGRLRLTANRVAPGGGVVFELRLPLRRSTGETSSFRRRVAPPSPPGVLSPSGRQR